MAAPRLLMLKTEKMRPHHGRLLAKRGGGTVIAALIASEGEWSVERRNVEVLLRIRGSEDE